MNSIPTLRHFAEHELGITMWPKLEEIFDAVQNGKRKILIRSCNGAGKTCALAAICNWRLKYFDESLVLTTASSHIQVKRNLWGEIRKQAKKGNLYKKGEVRENFIKITDKHYAIGISPAVKENAQGFHSEHMLIVVDEATGVSRDIINALFGNATGADSQIILAYNPIDTDSFVYEAEKNGDWFQIHISAFDHPNVKEHYDLIKGAVSEQWIADMLPTWSYEIEKGAADGFDFDDKTWRKTSEVASRIFGEWSDSGGDGFIPMYLVQRSCELPAAGGAKAMGIDIARSGKDETVFAFFEGNTQLPFETMRTKDLLEIAHKIECYYKEGWLIIALDDSGVGGGVTDILRSNGIPCHPVQFGSKAQILPRLPHRQLANARAEMYFILDEELKNKDIKLLDNRKLHQEITATRLRQSESREAYLLEEKTDIKRRLGRSPDRADATVLARYGLRLEKKAQLQRTKQYLI